MKIETNVETIDAIKDILEGQEDQPEFVRLYVAGFGWSGPSFGLALDELRDTDEIDDSNEIHFIMDKDLYTQYGDIKVEAMGGGFMVAPASAPEMDCGSCSGC